jgi:hypothetical protein
MTKSEIKLSTLFAGRKPSVVGRKPRQEQTTRSSAQKPPNLAYFRAANHSSQGFFRKAFRTTEFLFVCGPQASLCGPQTTVPKLNFGYLFRELVGFLLFLSPSLNFRHFS